GGDEDAEVQGADHPDHDRLGRRQGSLLPRVPRGQLAEKERRHGRRNFGGKLSVKPPMIEPRPSLRSLAPLLGPLVALWLVAAGGIVVQFFLTTRLPEAFDVDTASCAASSVPLGEIRADLLSTGRDARAPAHHVPQPYDPDRALA